jgi:hypothetical protein
MAVINATAVLLDDGWKHELYTLVGRKSLIAFSATAAAANGIAVVRYSGIEHLGIIVLAKRAAQ